MKRFTQIAVVFMLLFTAIAFYPTAVAQTDPCPKTAHEAWQQGAAQILGSYTDLLGKQPSDIKSVVALQKLRRDLEKLPDRPTCDNEAYETLRNALILSADSVASAANGDKNDAANLSGEAGKLKDKVPGLIVLPPSPSKPANANAKITEPADKSTIANFKLVVRGEYDVAAFGTDKPNQLWIFVVPVSRRFYPQITDGCLPNARQATNYEPDGTWAVPAFVGTETLGIGEPFDIYLMQGDAKATKGIYDKFDKEWCPKNDYPGLTSKEVFTDMGFKQIQRITVTRAK